MAKLRKIEEKGPLSNNFLNVKKPDEQVKPKDKRPFDDDEDDIDQAFEDLDYDNLEFDDDEED